MEGSESKHWLVIDQEVREIGRSQLVKLTCVFVCLRILKRTLVLSKCVVARLIFDLWLGLALGLDQIQRMGLIKRFLHLFHIVLSLRVLHCG